MATHVVGASFVVMAVSVAACTEGLQAPSTGPGPAERVVTASQTGQEIEIPKGDTFVLRPPFEGSGWQLDFAAEVLQLLTPPDRVSTPGPEGWRFRALGAGTTDLTMTASSDAGAAPRRFSLSIRVP